MHKLVEARKASCTSCTSWQRHAPPSTVHAPTHALIIFRAPVGEAANGSVNLSVNVHRTRRGLPHPTPSRTGLLVRVSRDKSLTDAQIMPQCHWCRPHRSPL